MEIKFVKNRKFWYIVIPIILTIILYLLVTKSDKFSLFPKKTEYVEAGYFTLNDSLTIEPSSISYARMEDGIQIIRMDISLYDLSPPIMVVQEGLETEWYLWGVEIDKSNNLIYFPEYETGFVNTGTNYKPKYVDLVKGENILTIIPRHDFLFKIRNGKTGFVKVVKDIEKIDTDLIIKDIQTFLPNLSCCILQAD